MPLQFGYAAFELSSAAAARAAAKEAEYERQQVLGVVIKVLAAFSHGEHHGTFCLLLVARLAMVVIFLVW